MRKLFIWIMALMLIAPPTYAQRPPEAVAQDGSDAPPLANEFGPQAAIADGLDTSAGGPLRMVVGPPQTTGDAGVDHGKYRLVCPVAFAKTVDPIVFPGQPGRSHLHQFFGNTAVDAFSTYFSLRTTGDSTCNNKLWGSAYWIPAMIDAAGKMRWPRPIIVYYQGVAIGEAECTPGNPKFAGRCVFLPNGYKMIAGKDMVTNTIPTGNISYKCVIYTDQNSGGHSGPERNDMLTAMSLCPTVPAGETGQKVIVSLLADMPQCWDGKNIDSPNHRSHGANYIRVPGVGQFCPKTHPYQIPNYTAQVQWEVDNTFIRTGAWSPGTPSWHLSCDWMPGMQQLRPGECYHFDLWDAANEAIKRIAFSNCINRRLSCNNGGLGDGTQLTPDPTINHAQKAPSIPPKMAIEAVHGILHGPM